MSIEQKINYQLNKYPAVKKIIKRAYQTGMYAISKKIKSEGNITRISPDDKNHEYFFGYYDKSPWDASDRYMLCMRANNTWSDVSPREKADILLIDTQKNDNDSERVKKIAETRAWNVQQGCMLQWLGPDFTSKILYNDYRVGKYVSIILNLATMEEKIIPAAVYSVSADGKFALTLDFSRLYELRPGYGYYNIPEKTKGIPLPHTTAIWKVDLETGKVTDLLKYTDFVDFQPRVEMKEPGSVHKVNHIMLCPNGKRFMVLYRWFNGHRKYTRLITCNVDGTDMYILSDDDMVSHCFWKNNNEILAFENKKKTGPGYYLMEDKTNKYIRCWPQFSNDGHPSYSPDRSLIVTDSYPDRARIASINLMDGDERKHENKTIAKVFAPFKYDNDTRCDLHPRWNHAGNRICFDSVFEGHRGLYVVDVTNMSDLTNNNEETYNPLLSVIVPVYKVEKYLKRCIDTIRNQTYKKLEIILVDDGSPDDCGRLCDEIAQHDERIKVIHKTNGGLSSARNAGIEIASGDFITFVDSDDWLDLNIYRKCINVFQKYKCDVVDFRAIFSDDNEKIINNSYFEPILVENDAILYDYLYRGQTEKCPFSVCRKVYSKALYSEIRFPEGKVNEDIATNFKVLQKCSKLVHISDIGYFYFQGNLESITNGTLSKKDFDLLDASKELCDLSKQYQDDRINNLARVKLARSYFSLLAKAATGGIDKDVNENDIRLLTKNLRNNYLLLMKSPISLNRKACISLVSINYKCIQIPYMILKKIIAK
mgnify:CR=1 FL=1